MIVVAIALALLAGVLWGTLGLISHYLLSYGLSVIQLSLIRLGGAFLLTFLIIITLGKMPKLGIQQWGWIFAIGLICQALGTVSFSSSVAGAGSSLAIVLLCTGPLFTVAINRIVYGEKIDPLSYYLILLGLLGLILTVTHSNEAGSNTVLFGKQWFYGIAWGLLSGFCYGLFPILSKALNSVSSWAVVCFSLGVGTAFLAPLQDNHFSLVQDNTAMLWLLIAALILVPTVIADVLYVRAVAIGGAIIPSVFALIEVPASIVYAFLWFSVPVSSAQWIGILMFCFGLIGLSLRKLSSSSDYLT